MNRAGRVLYRVEGVVACRVVERLNRFVVLVERDGSQERAHINNTGSLRGVLEKGRLGFCLEKSGGKTRYRLVAVECPGYREAALIDTWLQMRGFETSVEKGYLPWLRGCRVERRNPRVGSSLLDYVLSCGGEKVYVEVKSATLRLPGNLAAYPEPASMRGRRHVQELTQLARRGERAMLVFIAGIPGARGFTINTEADPLLPRLLEEAMRAGVDVRALSIIYDPRGSAVVLENPLLPIEL